MAVCVGVYMWVSVLLILVSHLILSNDSVCLSRLPPLQDDLLLIRTGLDGVQRHGTRD